MRAFVCGAALAALLGGAAQAAEPSMTYHYSLMQGVSVQECLQRARAALTQHNFQLAESTQNSQFGTQGDYLALVSCAPSSPTVFFVSIAGPQEGFGPFNQMAQQIRDRVVQRNTGPGPGPGRTK
jgi:hypothetical protein